MAVVGSNMNVLGIEVGGVELQQRILVAPGIAVDGRNEIRVCANGNITLRRSILRSNRQINITAGGEISGQGRIEGDVRNEGLVLARSPNRRLNGRWDMVPIRVGDESNLLRIEGDYYHLPTATLDIQVREDGRHGL